MIAVRSTNKPRKIAQKIFRDWCVAYGVVVDVEMAADLVRRITAALIVASENSQDDRHATP